MPYALQSRSVIFVAKPRPSCARTTADSPSRAIQNPLPSSPRVGPQPPARASSPFALRPKATEPVPEMITTPAPKPTAPVRAMRASVSTMKLPRGKKMRSASTTRWRCTG
jgi:hypothetical protein